MYGPLNHGEEVKLKVQDGREDVFYPNCRVCLKDRLTASGAKSLGLLCESRSDGREWEVVWEFGVPATDSWAATLLSTGRERVDFEALLGGAEILRCMPLQHQPSGAYFRPAKMWSDCLPKCGRPPPGKSPPRQ